MTDIVKNASQDAEAKIKTEEEHAKGKPSSETLNKAKVKARRSIIDPSYNTSSIFLSLGVDK